MRARKGNHKNHYKKLLDCSTSSFVINATTKRNARRFEYMFTVNVHYKNPRHVFVVRILKVTWRLTTFNCKPS